MKSPSVARTAAMQTAKQPSIVQRVAVFIWAHPGLSVFVLALMVRVFIAVVLSRHFSGTLVLDDTTYHQMAANMASGETAHWDDFTHQLYWTTATFMLPVTVLYKMFGPTTVVAQLMIGVVGAATALFVTRLAAEFLETRWALLAGLFVALLPSQAFWSSMLMKDAFVWFVLSGLGLTIALAARSSRGRLLMLVGVAAAFLIALSYLRLHTLVVASWAMGLAVFFGVRTYRALRVSSAIVVATLVPLIFGGIGAAGLGLVTNAGSLEERRFQNAVGANTAVVDTTEPSHPTQDTPQIVAIEEEVEELETEVQRLDAAAASSVASSAPEEAEELREQATAIREEIQVLEAQRAQFEGAAIREQIQVLEAQRVQFEGAPPQPAETGPLDPDVAHLPRGLSVMLIEPFPLPFSGTISLRLARLEAFLWYPLLVLAGLGLLNARRYLRQLAFPLIAGAGIVVMYALTEGNVGTAHRHRGEFVWVVALLAGLGVARLRGSAPVSPLDAPQA